MQQLNENHTFTGMQKDLAISRHPSTFLYDAHNIRLTARGKDTLLSITNERGPLKTGIIIEGTYLGHCLLRNYLTVFSTTTPVQQESITSTTSGSSRLYINHINRWQDSFQTDTPSTDTSQESTSGSTSDDETTTPTVLPDNVLPWQPVVTESTSSIVSNNSSTTEENSEENDEENNEEENTSSEEESSSEQTSTITSPDYITRIDLSTGEVVILYKGNLRFSPLYPIETIGSYENEGIQKIYWTDGLNQPRLINIVGEIKDDLDTQFDFIRELQLNETISIKKELGAAGMFPPGVIQYAFTYYTKYGQESNIFYTSPLIYTSYQDRGASPEDKVENAFRINITNLDTNFDYLRIYSIQRTSINGTPIVKRVQDIYTKAEAAEPEDRGVVESSTLPSVLIDGVYRQPDPLPQNGECSYCRVVQIDWDDVRASSPIFWYGFKRSDYPDLRIKTEYGYVTFDNNSSPSDDNIIWYSTMSYTKNGVRKYRVYQTNGYDDSGIYSTVDIRSVSFYDANTPLEGVSFLDTGTTEDSVDPTELLYKGGESLIVGTLAQKDSTLFFGNIQLNVPPIISNLKTQIKELSVEQDTRKFYPIKNFSDNYVYANQLNSYNGPVDSADNPISVPCGGFKRGDYYRCGIQFQYKDGKWSDPIFINDIQVTNKPSFRVLSVAEGTIPAGTAEATVPTLKVTIPSTDNVNTIAKTLISRGYKKARAVVVMPQLQDRVTICQGVLNPTMYTNNNRNSKKLFQSSWFFRPTLKGMAEPSDGTANPKATGTLHYTSNSSGAGYLPTYDPTYLRKVEIEGNFAEDDKFKILSSPLDRTIISTLHSPDIEFDDSLSLLDYIDVSWREVGISSVVTTFSDIDIQTESPTIGNNGAGFLNKGFVKSGTAGLISGLFYEDYVVDDNIAVASKFEAWRDEHSPVKWLIYPWHRTGSLNNDIKRPADSGARTAVLKKKVLSNLRYADTIFKDTGDYYEKGYTVSDLDKHPKVYNLDQIGIVKLGELVYQGNIDTLLLPDKTDGNYFAFDNSLLGYYNVVTAFNSTNWWKTFGPDNNIPARHGLYKWNGQTSSSSLWTMPDNHSAIGDVYNELVLQKEQVRMKYKSSPHLVAAIASKVPDGSIPNNTAALRIVEIIRNGAGNAPGTPKPHYRSTMFGGTSEDALKANIWIPCGEPVALNDTEDVVVQYSYGDTYYQRWDCLKTYPFTKEDINQIVEIGSFMLETRVNIDGRYDRNRGQVSNINMSPTNFNLLNPIYSQLNNFFTYRILDDDFYEINKFPNQITWSKEKQAGADIDLWTNVTLGSTYDMDGSKGSITALRVWKDNIYCFQDKGISNILFNSRVQIPVSDGVPIEITNSYKVEGYRYLSDGTGCTNKWTIKPTPSGIYFVNAVDNHLYHIGESLQDLTTVRNMTSWFNNVADNEIISTLYDDVNKDVYLLTNTEVLCYSELLGQFVSFMSYDGIYLIESNGNYIYTMRKIEPDDQGVQDNKDELYYMFNGAYNNFFGEQKGWDFTFISNGVDKQLMDFDKTYSTIDYRMDIFGYTLDNSNNTVETYEANKSFDYIRAFNEYQDSGIIPLSRLRRRPAVKNTPSPKYDYVGANMQKKFRVWRLQIPRNKNSLDRMRNTWCKIQLGNNGTENTRAVFYDLNVQYFI